MDLYRLSVTAGGAALAACSTGESDPAATTNPMAQQESPTRRATPRLYDAIVPFDGEHQAGIATPAQANLNLIGFNFVDGVDRGGLPSHDVLVGGLSSPVHR